MSPFPELFQPLFGLYWDLIGSYYRVFTTYEPRSNHVATT